MGRAFVAFVVLAFGVSGLVITTDRDAWAVLAREGPGGGSAGIAKHAGCKGKRVPVTVRHKTRCKPLTGAFPRPKAMDVRLAYLNDVLKLDLTGRGRRLSRSAVVARRRAARRLRAVPAEGIGVDRPTQTRPRRAVRGQRRTCRSRRWLPGVADVHGPSRAAHDDDVDGGERRGRRHLRSSLRGLYVPGDLPEMSRRGSVGLATSARLPSARHDASGGSHFETTEELRRGNSVVSRRSVTTDDKTTWRAQVGSDARLKYIDIAVRQECRDRRIRAVSSCEARPYEACASICRAAATIPPAPA